MKIHTYKPELKTYFTELNRAWVDERFQGRGSGQILCKAVIAEAKKRNLQKIILYSNSQLKAAISIYEKLGFKHLPPDSHEYTRADVKMELDLSEVEVDDTISSAII